MPAPARGARSAASDTTACAATAACGIQPATACGSASTTASETALDLRHGTLTQRPAEQCGDLLVKDRDGQWTYQFAVTVDDLDQEISLVIRGEDLIESTGRQLALARLLGRREPPLFLHHPMIYASPGVKLSKSAGDAGVRELRDAGVRPEAVVGRAAAAVGLVPADTPLPAREVHRLFGG